MNSATHTLTLFRRHEAACACSYPKEFRIYRHDSTKATQKKQCQCPISAEGTLLKTKLYVRSKGTGQREWSQAQATADQWGEWGALQPPTGALVPVIERTTFVQAVEKFKATLPDDDTMLPFLVRRLIPFAAERKINFIDQTDNPDIWIEFKASWTNQNPRKPEPGQPPVLKLKPMTVSIYITHLRRFLRFCVKRKWLSENWADREYMSQSVVVEQKEPFTDEELDYIYQAVGVSRSGQSAASSQETLAFIMTLENTGLRVSDTGRLESHQLVPFNSPPFKHAIYCSPQKTRRTRTNLNFVHIPIPGAMPGLRDLASTLEQLPVKQGRYFFRNGTGTMKTYINNWKIRVNKVLRIAEALMKKDGKKFSHHPHPHRFRHTFACRLLGWGVPLRIVAQYLGDTEDTVRRHYSKFCVAEQHQAAAVYGEAMQRRAEKTKARLQLVKV